MLISCFSWLLLWFCFVLTLRDSFSLQQKVQSCLNIMRSCGTRSGPTPNVIYINALVILSARTPKMSSQVGEFTFPRY